MQILERGVVNHYDYYIKFIIYYTHEIQFGDDSEGNANYEEDFRERTG